VTLPTPDAQSPKSLPTNFPMASLAHSNPSGFSSSSTPPIAASLPGVASPATTSRERASGSADFSHSWDLATGGFKTLTAKRELPPRQQRRVNAAPTPLPATHRSYLFLLIILACIVVMRISGGVVLFMTLQP
jgi:hypothetical protein